MAIKKVGILGATGTVGQRFITLLSDHPEFKIAVLGASARSAGKPYAVATKWKQSIAMPKEISQMSVKACDPKEFSECDIVFSGLDADFAGEIEKSFRDANLVIVSNAKNYRREPTVPLVVPTVNTDHLDVIKYQRQENKLDRGCIITNSNCSTAAVVVPLKALQDAFGPIAQTNVVSMQAISGAGYPGVSSLDILDNIVPFIGGEEEKIEWETRKILGSVNSTISGYELTDNVVSAQCNRVPVIDGHLMCISVKFAKTSPTPDQVREVLANYVSEPQKLGCYSAPKQAIYVFDDSTPDRPQPRLDRNNENGYAVSVGRIRSDSIFDIKFVSLVHNTVLGAAGAGILNAEVAVKKGLM
ncbi:aspartate semialdehyde dehydrogenase Hom2 [Schizosaccharomyces pombe]|uniref:Aspartate-semialdehyde dehydrogenase n=1 Tax=Schizosaccharomyces pombe (strain 972 / ATCC 24843) TaxID=284812 RepID=DHAS_SCHPO|nr:putative aspartate semialdehyde dehydrogenase [Schizosaccharomyces pombe]P78780.2 RecName: Full=Probable aspartate-semialdehyde dehydrogenase; Short=ASA dehydrogenase; Short=ASADH; AltName: Full=Aspartate-beta-semialdehyde dehydrogenase [Schizosaccharomyces pombe 972h-]CAA19314.1 aspartate semialdehyde dehydrogenase (predicted) [Schizosaccharomyces pombe]|eukprot:NP_588552.1 putative aspartate semialdehyde dehydrogenase [Schizosaccharomyces pombe]